MSLSKRSIDVVKGRLTVYAIAQITRTEILCSVRSVPVSMAQTQRELFDL